MFTSINFSSLTKLLQGLLSEVEVKYKMSQCYLHLKEYREATTIVCEVVSPNRHLQVFQLLMINQKETVLVNIKLCL